MEPSRILGLQPRDKAAMLGFKTIEVFSKNLHENRVWLPEKRNAFFLDHHQGRPYVTCKPAMKFPWALKSLTNISSVHKLVRLKISLLKPTFITFNNTVSSYIPLLMPLTSKIWLFLTSATNFSVHWKI